MLMLEMYLGYTHVFVTLHVGYVWYTLHYIIFADGDSELLALPQIFGTAFWHLRYDVNWDVVMRLMDGWVDGL